jgi:hypothetical protein
MVLANPTYAQKLCTYNYLRINTHGACTRKFESLQLHGQMYSLVLVQFWSNVGTPFLCLEKRYAVL